MAKTKYKSVWFCKECGHESPKWEGRCPGCGAWSTMIEEKVQSGNSSTKTVQGGLMPVELRSKPIPVSQIVASDEPRIHMPSEELNRVLGGGLVVGSVVLIGGEPGIGKSTLVLQNILAIKSKKILYVSGEESATQLRMRADRLGRVSDNVYIVCETNLDHIQTHIRNVDPGILIIDSIQTIASPDLESPAGSVSQVRECAATLLRYAKTSGVPVLIVGHINKDGAIAGPKVLEHIVDVVLQFEGDTQYLYRLLRAIKNRFGSTSELGIYEMCQRGLREVSNPSELLLSHNRSTDLSGICIGVTMEGQRSFLVEAQALVSTAAYGTPQRSVTGFDGRRMNMLLAVMEKRVGFKLTQKDVFLNIAGGLKVNDPGLDLAVICAILSSSVDTPLPEGICVTGEVGLSGEIRPITRIEQRIMEAQRLGFKAILIPKGSLKGVDREKLKIKILEAEKVEEAVRILFAGSTQREYSTDENDY